jgi:hypothetical protein
MPCDCPHHGEPAFGRVCVHLLAPEPPGRVEHFTCEGKESWLACRGCGETPDLRDVCRACWAGLHSPDECEGITGRPAIAERPSTLRVVHEVHELPLPGEGRVLAMRPVGGHDAQHWVALMDGGQVYCLDLDRGDCTVAGLGVLTTGAGDLRVSDDGRHAAVFSPAGRLGAVIDLSTSRVTMHLEGPTGVVRG